MELADHILAKFGTLEAISRANVAQLIQIKGVGRTKAVQLAAAFALGARLSRSQAMIEDMDEPVKVYQLLGNEMRLLPQESVRVILLNTKYRLMAVEEISRGSLDSVIAHPREVFRPAIARQAYALILVHNHPSGDPTPSLPDHQITTQLKKAAEFLDIKFYDHVILGAPRGLDTQAYYSFRENGFL